MAKNKNKNRISVEKALAVASLPRLDQHTMASAEKRVWNQLAHSIGKLENQEKESVQTETPKMVFWQRSYIKFTMSFVFILLLVVGSSGLFWYIGTNIGNDNGNNTAQNVNPKTDEFNVKELAASRFSQLNGVTFEEFKEVIEETPPTPTTTPIANVFTTPSTTQLIPNTNTEVKVDEAKVIELAKKAQSNIFYSKQELVFSNNFNAQSEVNSFGLGQGLITRIDYTKPLVYESWVTVNYSKSKLTQGEKIILEYVSTPEFLYSYVGGEYAVKVEYLAKRYSIAGLTNDGTSIPNPEIELLRFILTSPGADKARVIMEGNKELVVIETEGGSGGLVSPLGESRIKTKYYLDKNTFTLVRIKQYLNDKLILSNLNIQSQKIENREVNSIFTIGELESEISVKTTQYDIDNNLQKIVDQSSVGDFIKNYDLLYFKDKEKKDLKVIDYKSEKYLKFQEYQNLINTKEFNPLFEESVLLEKPLAYYYFPNIKVDVNVYKNEPDLTEKNRFNIETSEIDIHIENTEQKAVLFIKSENLIPAATVTPSPSITGTPAITSTITERIQGLKIKYNENWYVFQSPLDSSTTSSAFNSDSSLLKLSVAEANDIDTSNGLVNKNELEKNNLTDIDANERYLPGNLKD